MAALPMESISRKQWKAHTVPSVELSLKCKNLTSGLMRTPDPMVVMYTKGLAKADWQEFSKTEVVKNSANPVFMKKFVIDYFHGEKQELRFDVYNKPGTVLGSVKCTLQDIVGRSKFTKVLGAEGKPQGRLEISAEELSPCEDVLYMKWCGEDLDRKDVFGKSDPFMLFYKYNDGESFSVCHKTEVIMNTLNPSWKQIDIAMRILCNNDTHRVIKVEIWDWNRSGKHELIGAFETNVHKLLKGQCRDNAYECKHPKKIGKKTYKHSGIIRLKNIQKEKRYTFLDYLKAGTEINAVLAVDFTSGGSNSLHSRSPNLYEVAIQAVGQVVEDYDYDKLLPAYGFGAKIPTESEYSYDFPLDFVESKPLSGTSGVLEAYRSCLKTVKLGGAPNFAPIIRKVSRMAAQAAEKSSAYYVLVIFTNGEIADKSLAIEEIVKAALLPLSIIIVGLGNGDFTAMEELDGDEVRLSHNGEKAQRDIVQFVPFREHMAEGRTQVLSQSQLAKEVLAEIPDQVVDYMRMNKMKPGQTADGRPIAARPSPGTPDFSYKSKP